MKFDGREDGSGSCGKSYGQKLSAFLSSETADGGHAEVKSLTITHYPVPAAATQKDRKQGFAPSSRTQGDATGSGAVDVEVLEVEHQNDHPATNVSAILLSQPALPFPNLRELELSNNTGALDELPDSVFSACASSLEFLRLNDNSLEYLPASLLCCKKLKSLHLARNKLAGKEALHPLFFECLPELRTLNLDGNAGLQSVLPGGAGASLPRPHEALRELSLSGCDVGPLLECYGIAFPQLTELNLRGNKLKSLQVTDVPEGRDAAGADGSTTATAFPAKLKSLLVDENPFDTKLVDKKLVKTISEAADSGKAMKALLSAVLRGGESKRKQKQKTAKEAEEAAENAKITELPGRVDPQYLTVQMSREFRIARPTWLAVAVKNMGAFVTAEHLQAFMGLQTKLQKNRKRLCIGTHDLALIGDSWDFSLECVDPNTTTFAPLNGKPTTIREFIEGEIVNNTEKAEYANRVGISIAAGSSSTKVPVFKASGRSGGSEEILSLYPVSNSECTRNSLQMRNCLIEVSGNISYGEAAKVVEELLSFLDQGVSAEDGSSSLFPGLIVKGETQLQRVKVVAESESMSGKSKLQVLACYGEDLEMLVEKFPKWMGEGSL
eukprot:g6427.t1